MRGPQWRATNQHPNMPSLRQSMNRTAKLTRLRASPICPPCTILLRSSLQGAAAVAATTRREPACAFSKQALVPPTFRGTIP